MKAIDDLSREELLGLIYNNDIVDADMFVKNCECAACGQTDVGVKYWYCCDSCSGVVEYGEVILKNRNEGMSTIVKDYIEMENAVKITYEREVGHCEPSPYVKEVTIKSIDRAMNSDRLFVISFVEMGWNAVTALDTYEVGQQVMFIPAESVLPFELSEKLDVTKYLSKGRIKVTRLRGNRSEGLIVKKEEIDFYIPYILKWEDLPSVDMSGEAQKSSEISPDFIRFYKMPNILNEPFTFKVGDKLWYSEKIHGTNGRWGWLKHPQTEEFVFHVGSHTVAFKPDSEKRPIYRRVVEGFEEKFPKDVEFFGEVYGQKIQDLTYGETTPKFKIFAGARRGEYIPINELIKICDENGLPHVNFHEITFESLEQVRELADAPSEVTDKHLREGIVMVSAEYPEKMAKCISFNYLDRKGKKTERH